MNQLSVETVPLNWMFPLMIYFTVTASSPSESQLINMKISIVRNMTTLHSWFYSRLITRDYKLKQKYELSNKNWGSIYSLKLWLFRYNWEYYWTL